MSNPDISPKSTSPGRVFTFLYRTCFSLAAVSAGIIAAFFIIGILDGSVSAFNMRIWLILLAGLVAVLWAGCALRSRGYTGAAITVHAIIAVPGLTYGLFLLLVLVMQPRWN